MITVYFKRKLLKAFHCFLSADASTNCYHGRFSVLKSELYVNFPNFDIIISVQLPERRNSLAFNQYESNPQYFRFTNFCDNTNLLNLPILSRRLTMLFCENEVWQAKSNNRLSWKIRIFE